MSKKNLLHLLAIMMVAMLSVGFASCGDDDDDDYVPKGGQTTTAPETPSADPEGTVTVNLKIGDYSIKLKSTLWCEIWMNQANNFLIYGEGCRVEIASVGEVKGLSSITKIPVNGWTNGDIAVVPKQGYVIRIFQWDYQLSAWMLTPSEYIRIYVTDYMKTTAGGIIGCTIKYQKWYPTAQ